MAFDLQSDLREQAGKHGAVGYRQIVSGAGHDGESVVPGGVVKAALLQPGMIMASTSTRR